MTFITNPDHSVKLGGLALMASGKPVPYGTYTLSVLSEGTGWGNSQPITATLLSLLTDGSIESTLSYDNRGPSLTVEVEATTYAGLVAGEVALAAVCAKSTTLEWLPPSGGVWTVFDVVNSRLEFVMDDFNERRLRRRWLITLSALPHGRSRDLIISPAINSAAALTVVDTGSATTGWTAGGFGGTVSVVAGAVTATFTDGVVSGILTRTGAIDTSTTKYLAIDWKSSLARQQRFTVDGDTDVAEVRRDGIAGGYTRSFIRVPDATTSVGFFGLSLEGLYYGSGTHTLSIDQIQRTSSLPVSGSTRQKSASIIPGGSARTSGNLHITHPTSALGKTIVFTHPTGSGYQPPLRQWRTSSPAVTADAATVSGSRNALVTTPTWFDVPVSALPKGDVQLWARLRLATGAAATVGLYYGFRAVMNGVEIFNQEDLANISLPGSAAWVMVPLARSVLPPVDLGINGVVRIYLLRATVHDIELDEAWLFAMDKGRLTVVDCGSAAPSSGGASNHLWINAPSLDAPAGKILVGNNANGSDTYWPNASAVQCSQVQTFDPAGTNVFVVTDNAADASTDLTHYRRWATHAGT